MANIQNSKIINCPGSAFHQLPSGISPQERAEYINTLLKTGFDTIEIACFGSSTENEQTSSIQNLLDNIDLTASNSKLMAIVPNFRAAVDALQYDDIKYLAFPFSISKTYLKEHFDTNLDEGHQTIKNLHHLCQENLKQLVINIEMAFGNPYGDYYDLAMLDYMVEQLEREGISHINLIDSTGSGSIIEYQRAFDTLIIKYPSMEFGLRLFTHNDEWLEKLETAYESGCRRFDIINNELAEHITFGKHKAKFLSTQQLQHFLGFKKENQSINLAALEASKAYASRFFK